MCDLRDDLEIETIFSELRSTFYTWHSIILIFLI